MFGGETGKEPAVEPLKGDIETQSRLVETWLNLPFWVVNSWKLVREGSSRLHTSCPSPQFQY